MAFTHSKDSRLMVNDRNLSMHISGWSCSHQLTVSDVTVLGNGGHTFIPGLLNGTLNMNGFVDPDAQSLFTEMLTARTATEGLVVTAAPAGFTENAPAFLTISNTSDFSVDASVTDAVSMTIGAQPNLGVDWGRLLHPPTEESSGSESTPVDHGDETSNGGSATLHVAAGSGELDVVIEHSPDDAVYVPLIEFAQATGPSHTFARVQGTVDRFVRVTWSLTAPFTFAVGFARR